MRLLALAVLLVPPLLLGTSRPLAAQSPTVPVETFVVQVARLWHETDVQGLLDLAAASGQILLDTGSGSEAVNERHAAAALRALFAERESVMVRPVRATLAGGRPARGFGELSWSFRSRGMSAAQTRSVYVGMVWEEAGWRITELRVMP